MGVGKDLCTAVAWGPASVLKALAGLARPIVSDLLLAAHSNISAIGLPIVPACRLSDRMSRYGGRRLGRTSLQEELEGPCQDPPGLLELVGVSCQCKRCCRRQIDSIDNVPSRDRDK